MEPTAQHPADGTLGHQPQALWASVSSPGKWRRPQRPPLPSVAGTAGEGDRRAPTHPGSAPRTRALALGRAAPPPRSPPPSPRIQNTRSTTRSREAQRALILQGVSARGLVVLQFRKRMNGRRGAAPQTASRRRGFTSAAWEVTVSDRQSNTHGHTRSEAPQSRKFQRTRRECGRVPDAHGLPPFILRPTPGPPSGKPQLQPPSPTGPAPPAGGLSPAPRTPREPVTPPSEGLAKGPASPLPSAPRPGGAAVPSAAEEGRDAGPARLSSPGTLASSAGPRQRQHVIRGRGQPSGHPFPGFPLQQASPLPQPLGAPPDRGRGARGAPRSPRGKEGGDTPILTHRLLPLSCLPHSSSSLQGAAILDVQHLPRREMPTTAAASATKKSAQLGLPSPSTPAADDRGRQPRWTEEAVLLITGGENRPRKSPGEFVRSGGGGGGDGRKDPERRPLKDLVTLKEAKRRAGAAGGATRGSEGRG